MTIEALIMLGATCSLVTLLALRFFLRVLRASGETEKSTHSQV